jgi:hypothetical protein
MAADLQAVAGEVFAALGTGRQIPLFTARAAGLTLDESYRALACLDEMREARGEKRLHQPYDLGAIQGLRTELGLHLRFHRA